MISAILGQVTGQLEKRFILNAFFPVLVFVVALGVAIAVGTGGTAPAIDLWEEQDSATKVLLAIGAVGLVFLLANLLSNGMQQVIGLFEGYVPPASLFASWARNRQLRRAANLLQRAESDFEAEDRFQRRFPVHPRKLSNRDVAPTKLGNVMLSAESYSFDRYGVDAVRIWSRLYPLLPAELRDAMVAARTSMEFLLGVSFLAAFYAPVASIYLIADAASLAWILGALGVSAAISWAAYEVSLGPAATYGELVRSAFDLHRLEVLEALRAPMPAGPDEERRAWAEATRLLELGEVRETRRYVDHS